MQLGTSKGNFVQGISRRNVVKAKEEGPRMVSDSESEMVRELYESGSKEAKEIRKIKTPIVIVSADLNVGLRFIKKNVVLKCAKAVYKTNYPVIYLAEKKLRAALNTIRTQDIKLELYFNN